MGLRTLSKCLIVGCVFGILSWQAFVAYKIKHDFQQAGVQGPMVHHFHNMARGLSTLPVIQKPFEIKHDVSESNIQAARQEMLAIVGHTGINENPGDLKSRSSTEWSPYTGGRYALIVFPQSTLQVSNIMKVCWKRKIPVTGFSGGTSLDGALAATRGGICIDFSRMNRILEFHDRDLDVVVQPAVGWEALNDYLDKYGLFFPPDPGPGAQIGGMIGTGCSGTNAYRYGTMKDWVIAMTVVLADGTIVKTRNRPRKSTAGYDLTRLMVGSSGTLGLVTEAVLKITAKPENEHVAVVAFPNTKSAVSAVIDMVQQGLPLAAIELLDENTMKAVNQNGYSDKAWTETPTLFLKFDGTQQAVKGQISVVDKLAQAYNRKSFESSGDPGQIDAFWSARKTALWSLIAQKRHPDDQFISSDVAVPLSRLAEIIEEAKENMRDAGLLGSIVGHVGDGNFHTSILYGEKDKAAAEKITADLQRRAIAMGGTITGEHGIGLALRDMLQEELGQEAVDMMRKASLTAFVEPVPTHPLQIKYALDPNYILNCDKIVRMEATDPSTDHS